jgi:hypothetical protein
MPRVRLLHPITIFIRKAELENTAIMDDNLHEPIGQIRRKQKPIKLKAQHTSNAADNPKASMGGVVEESDGNLLFRTSELRDAKATVDRGDRVVQIGEGDNAITVDYYITKLKYLGHYPGNKGSTLLKAFYEDRHPSRQRGDL